MKKTKKMSLGLIAASLMALSLTAPAVVSAATATTTGDVTFTKPTNAVNPVNPTDPTKPVDPVDPTNPATGQTGALTLDVAPVLPFGTHEIESGSHTYALNADASKGSVNKNPYLQVSDRRGVANDGQAQGWNVTVQMSDFTAASGAKLAGASLAFKDAQVKTATGDTSKAPAQQNIANLSSASSATTIFSAAKGQGLGTWLSVYDPANIELTVPTPGEGAYTSTLTWTMNEGPTA